MFLPILRGCAVLSREREHVPNALPGGRWQRARREIARSQPSPGVGLGRLRSGDRARARFRAVRRRIRPALRRDCALLLCGGSRCGWPWRAASILAHPVGAARCSGISARLFSIPMALEAVGDPGRRRRASPVPTPAAAPPAFRHGAACGRASGWQGVARRRATGRCGAPRSGLRCRGLSRPRQGRAPRIDDPVRWETLVDSNAVGSGASAARARRKGGGTPHREPCFGYLTLEGTGFPASPPPPSREVPKSRPSVGEFRSSNSSKTPSRRTSGIAVSPP